MGESPYPFADRRTLDLVPAGYIKDDNTHTRIIFDDDVNLAQWPWAFAGNRPWFLIFGGGTAVLGLQITAHNVISVTHVNEVLALSGVAYFVDPLSRGTFSVDGRQVPNFINNDPQPP